MSLTRRRFLRTAASGLFVPAAYGQVMLSQRRVATPKEATSPPPDPSTVPSTWAWWTADVNLTLTSLNYDVGATPFTDFQNASDWVDRTTNARHLKAICGNPAVFYKDGAGGSHSTGLPNSVACYHYQASTTIGGLAPGFVQMTIPGPAQPYTVYLVARIGVWNNSTFMIDVGNVMPVGCAGSSPQVGIYTGAAYQLSGSEMGIGQWHIITAIGNNASSSIQIDNGTVHSGTATGTQTPTGHLTLGVINSGSTCAAANVFQGDIAAIVIASAANTAGDQATIKNWLAYWSGLTI